MSRYTRATKNEGSMKTYRELSMSPNLLAFNMFASEMRLVLRDASLLSRAEMHMGIEKVIGNRWKAMTAEEKEKHIDKARVEQARLIAEGGMPQTPASSGRAKKQKHDGDNAPTVKRRRGRPPKVGGLSAPMARGKTHSMQAYNMQQSMPMGYQASMNYGGTFMDMQDDDDDDDANERDPYALYNMNDHTNFQAMNELFMPFNSGISTAIIHSAANNYDPKSFIDGSSLTQPAAAKDYAKDYSLLSAPDSHSLGHNVARAHAPATLDLTGMSVEGIIDGSFDNGYFVSFRVNGQVLRGMMYREDTCMRTIASHANAFSR